MDNRLPFFTGRQSFIQFTSKTVTIVIWEFDELKGFSFYNDKGKSLKPKKDWYTLIIESVTNDGEYESFGYSNEELREKMEKWKI